MLAIENSDNSGYISEKSFLAYLAGSIPIVWGCRSLREMLQPSTYIDLFSFSEDQPKLAAKSAVLQMRQALISLTNQLTENHSGAFQEMLASQAEEKTVGRA